MKYCSILKLILTPNIFPDVKLCTPQPNPRNCHEVRSKVTYPRWTILNEPTTNVKSVAQAYNTSLTTRLILIRFDSSTGVAMSSRSSFMDNRPNCGTLGTSTLHRPFAGARFPSMMTADNWITCRDPKGMVVDVWIEDNALRGGIYWWNVRVLNATVSCFVVYIQGFCVT